MHHGFINLRLDIAKLPRADRSSKVCRMLVVRRWRTVSHASVHIVSKVEDAAPRFEEKLGRDRDPVAEATRKKMASRAAS